MIFTLREYELIKGKKVFYELLKDGRSLLSEFEEDIQSRYESEYKTILAYMNLVADNNSVPTAKFKPLKGNKDGINEYEFRSKHLRIYLIQLEPHGKIIILGGYKNQQEKDIRQFRSIKKQYLDSLKNR